MLLSKFSMINTGITPMATRAGAAVGLMNNPTQDTSANDKHVKNTKTMRAFGLRSSVRYTQTWAESLQSRHL